MRPRRHDPDRRGRILQSALDVVAEDGVARTTHRLIAARADVPLGSLTYHFTGLDDLLAQAFALHAQRMGELYAAHFADVRGRPQFVDAVTDLIHDSATTTSSDWVIAYELYLAALRDPALRAVTDAWMKQSRVVLERHVEASTARAVDALVEGLVLHQTLSTSQLTRRQIRDVVEAAISAADGSV